MACLAIASISLEAQIDWKLNGNNVSGDSKLGTNNGYDLIFETANLERLRLTDSGYLGIGLASPLFTLDIIGDLRLDGEIRFPLLASSDATELAVLAVGADGKVVTKILKSGAGDLVQDIYVKDCNPFIGPDGAFYQAPVWQSAGGPNAEDAKLFTGSVCPALVGIGTNSPQFDLHVAGETRTSRLGINADPNTDAYLQLGVFGQSSDGLTIDFNSSNDNRVAVKLNAPESADKVLQVNNTTTGQTVLEINAAGQLIIRPSSPTAKAITIKDASNVDVFRFSTDGVMWSTEVNVALKEDFFPDYVFEKEYDLMPMGLLRQYIDEEKHLPNVPTAEEVKEQGLNLGKMQVIQMEKIEENTLYILQLEERLQKLEEQNTQMAKLIEELQNK